MAFPSSPSNGQIATVANVIYFLQQYKKRMDTTKIGWYLSNS